MSTLGIVWKGLAAVGGVLMVVNAVYDATPPEGETVQVRDDREVAMRQVRNGMKDPDSAQFRDVFQREEFVCGYVNAKNGFGAYVGFSRFRYVSGDVLLEANTDSLWFWKEWEKYCLGTDKAKVDAEFARLVPAAP
ncbi:MAG TPA: hypothetical protein VK641_13475 [Terriglobales bacterium]|nr:hypothetical protein [Terriglobales bacterium]